MINIFEQHFKRLHRGAESKQFSFLADDIKIVKLNLHTQKRANEWAYHLAKNFKHSVCVCALPKGPEPAAYKLELEVCEIEGETFFGLRSFLMQLLKDTAFVQFEDLPPSYQKLINTHMQFGELALSAQRIENLPFVTVFVGQGATLLDLTLCMLKLGAVGVLNLDRGGLAQLFESSGTLIDPADKRGIPFASYGRLVPSALVLSK